MTQEDLAELARATHELKLKEETPDPPEALKCVPIVSLQDIPGKLINVPAEVGNVNGVKVLQHDLFKNDVLYAEVGFQHEFFETRASSFSTTSANRLLEMGTKDLDFVQLNQLIGGISVYPFTSSIQGKEETSSHIIALGKDMSECAEDLFNLTKSI